MKESNLDISVVICSYAEDRWNDLVAAVESVQRQSVMPREIIVVIDHNPALLERVCKHLPGVIAIENKGLPGASSSRNSGVEVTQSALVAFLDDDAIAESDWLEQLVAGYADLMVLGVGGALIPNWLGAYPKWFPSEFNWVVGCTYTGMPEDTAPVRNLIAANMSVRREIFDSVGGFRADYGNVKVGPPTRAFLFRSCAGDEETEFCIQALRRWPKGTWLYMPQARVHHKVSSTRASWKYYLRRCYDEGVGKALLSRLVGVKDGLASERAYTLRVLPEGVARGVRNALRGDVTGLAHASAIVVGLAATTTGYLMGVIHTKLTNRKVTGDEVFPVQREIEK